MTLGQGITNFKQKKISSKQRDELIEKTVEYFQKEVDKDLLNIYGFSVNPIDLGSDNSLAKGYAKTAIISKYYNADNFDLQDFNSSLKALLTEYQIICEHIGDKSYDDIIDILSPLEGIEYVDVALENITLVLKEEFVDYSDIQVTPIKVVKGEKRSNKYGRLTQKKVYKKIDYFKQAKENYQTGLKGEQLFLRLEKDRLIKLGVDHSQYLRWMSIESDSYGYDFESIEMRNGRLAKIFVEVKATKDQNDTPFFLSKNELDISKIKKESYRLFRIFDLASINPKYYYADGEIEENFYIDPVTYQVRYKYDLFVDKD